MKVLHMEQGSPEWLAARRKYITASEAPIIMGASGKTSRRELLHMKALGNEKEFSDYVLNVLFERGHEAEENARPMAEDIVGDELFRITGVDDNDELLASFDGLTLMFDVGWEHKLYNEDKATHIATGKVPPEDHWQVVHQFAVSGASRILYMISDGTRHKRGRIWVDRNQEDIDKLMRGIALFKQDLEKAKADPSTVAPAAPKPIVESLPALPPLLVDISGEVNDTNIVTYSEAVMARIEAIPTDLNTDVDFVRAEDTVKFLDNAEKEIERVKKLALSQTTSINDLFQHLDQLSDAMRTKRLNLSNQVKKRKDEIREEIAERHIRDVHAHVKSLNEKLGHGYLPMPITLLTVKEAMKGKRTQDTLNAAADHVCLNAKLEADMMAELVGQNLAAIQKANRPELFNDIMTLVRQERVVVDAEITTRINRADEQARIRADQEERAKQQREENDRVAAEQEKARRAEASTAASAGAAPSTVNEEVEFIKDALQTALDEITGRKYQSRGGMASAAEISECLQSMIDDLDEEPAHEGKVAATA